jgi:hypothetical protein
MTSGTRGSDGFASARPHLSETHVLRDLGTADPIPSPIKEAVNVGPAPAVPTRVPGGPRPEEARIETAAS